MQQCLVCSEVDFVCFDFMPRHDNIIRWRMGRCLLLDLKESNYKDR